MSYLTVFTDTTNNETEFIQPEIFFEEHSETKVQEGYVLKYLNFRIYQSPIGFSVDKTDHIMEVVN